ncbi:hypothetical protein E7T06_01705 [Deinococcus sp. Arct2-2]|uniref:TapB family protein n=1 Tax=Deinococcus sp. Arct2-2 TaxID=2568653 RepID=UPI0010A56702|nr:hypothetical protein [Deinococcus sp. Arct2-2]THF71696.1 hypothetical protein E7T06_01705 [Deinococcus sp. Arct2-2]
MTFLQSVGLTRFQRSALWLGMCALPAWAGAAACDTQSYIANGTATYQMVSPAGKTTIVSKAVVKGSSVQVTSTIDGNSTNMVWNCTAKGMTASLPTGKATASFDLGFLPPSSAWKVGYSWTSTGKISGMAGMTINTSTRSKITASERVTTPAGTFTALRVESTSASTVQLPPGMQADAMSKAMNSTTTSTAWYAKGVGTVKSTSPESKFTMTLIKFVR